MQHVALHLHRSVFILSMEALSDKAWGVNAHVGGRSRSQQSHSHADDVGLFLQDGKHRQTGLLMRRVPSATTAAVASVSQEKRKNHFSEFVDRDQFSQDERSKNSLHNHDLLEAFVLQMFGDETKWHQYLVQRYSEQLRTSNIGLAVLRDVSNSRKPMQGGGSLLQTEARYASGTALVRHWRAASVPICEVTWSNARDHFPDAAYRIQNISRIFNPWNPMEPHQFHGPFQVLWWNHCAQSAYKRKPDRVWFAEADAFFTGNVQDFLWSFRKENADLVAGGFRIAGRKWWQWNKFSDILPTNFTSLTTQSRVVTNLDVLPTLAQGRCNNAGSDDTEGVLFREDHVERVSSRVLDKQSEDLRHNIIIMPSEVWAPTICATRLVGCTALDFAPLLTSHETWASPAYCWAGDNWKAAERCDGCRFHSAWTSKWIHPVKSDVWAAVDCKCRDGASH